MQGRAEKVYIDLDRFAMIDISAKTIESGLKSPNTTVLIKTTSVIGSISKVFGDRFAANHLFRADSLLLARLSIFSFQ